MVLIDADCNCRVDSGGPNPTPLLEVSLLLPPSQITKAGQFPSPAAAHWGTDGGGDGFREEALSPAHVLPRIPLSSR